MQEVVRWKILYLFLAVVHGVLDASTIVSELTNRYSVHKPRSKWRNVPIVKINSDSWRLRATSQIRYCDPEGVLRGLLTLLPWSATVNDWSRVNKCDYNSWESFSLSFFKIIYCNLFLWHTLQMWNWTFTVCKVDIHLFKLWYVIKFSDTSPNFMNLLGEVRGWYGQKKMR